MPGIRERNENDKLKGKGGKPAQNSVRRQLTAKFRKELAQQKQSGGDRPEVEAADQVEQATQAAVEETYDGARRGVSRAVDTASRRREQHGTSSAPAPTTQETTRANQMTPGARMRQKAVRERRERIKEKDLPTQRAELTVEHAPPTPEDRMREKMVQEQRAQHRAADLPGSGTDPAPMTSQHYGGRQAAPNTPPKPLSPQNQSINPSIQTGSIKERPRRSAILKEKRPGGAFTPRAQQITGKQAARTSKAAKTVSGQNKKAPAFLDKARKRVQKNAQRQMLQTTKKTARTTAQFATKAAQAAASAVSSMVSALAGLAGGSVLAIAICVLALVGAIIASPFGILFSNEPTPGAIPLNAAVASINMEVTDELSALQSGNYDDVTVAGQPPDWREVAAVFAAKTAGAADGVDVAMLDTDRVARLRAVFWDMCTITSEVETIDHPDTDPDDDTDDSWTEYILHITISAKTADEMRTFYNFTDYQNQALTELLADPDLLDEVLGSLGISTEDAAALLRSLPANLSPERRAVIEKALTLVGKVNYFWGGKSLRIGWDSRWGTIQQVTAAGSSTTGTYRPYGLDCSGFVDWVFYNATGGDYIIGHGGGAHAQHTYCNAISWEEAIPGDLVFYPDDSHVGVVGGRDENGNLIIIHCASSANNVVITGVSGFTSIGRPVYFSD